MILYNYIVSIRSLWSCFAAKCEDVLSQDMCEYNKNLCQDASYEAYMKENCYKTCG